MSVLNMIGGLMLLAWLAWGLGVIVAVFTAPTSADPYPAEISEDEYR